MKLFLCSIASISVTQDEIIFRSIAEREFRFIGFQCMIHVSFILKLTGKFLTIKKWHMANTSDFFQMQTILFRIGKRDGMS